MKSALEKALGERLGAVRPVAGGDLNDALRVELASGALAFVKTRRDAPLAEFEAEAAGLRWLAEAGSLRVPEVLAVGEGEEGAFLALEWIESRGGRELGAELGEGLARIHLQGAPAHGALPSKALQRSPSAPPTEVAGKPGGVWRVGPVALPVGSRESWAAFHGEQQLMPLARRAHRGGALSRRGLAAVERVCERLDDLAGPPEPPARLHGDLWSGNVIADERGRPCLIDPAAYGGHREVDLAMLRLFGSPDRDFDAAYESVHPLAPGAAERVELLQLLPLLIHAVLFGGSYGASVERIARRYAGP